MVSSALVVRSWACSSSRWGLTGLAAAQLPAGAHAVQTPRSARRRCPSHRRCPCRRLPCPRSRAAGATAGPHRADPVPTAPAPAPVRNAERVRAVGLDAVGLHPRGVGAVRLDARVSTPASGPRSGAGSASSGSGGAARGAASGAAVHPVHPVQPPAPRAPRPADRAASGSERERRRRRTARAGHSSSGATDNSRAAKVRRRDRALRRAVLRFQGCLSRVPRAERRVLTLRAGVGAARTHSRTEVARITHLRRTRVITLERRGLRRLHALGRAGACQDADADVRGGAGGRPARRCLRASTPGGRGAVLAEHHSSDSKDGGAHGHSASPTPSSRSAVPRASPATAGFDLTLVFAPLGRPRLPARGHARGQAQPPTGNSGHSGRRRDRLTLGVGELELGGAQRVGDRLGPARAGDRDDRRPEREQPRQRDLLGRDAVRLGRRGDRVDARRPTPTSRCRPAATRAGRRCRDPCTPAARPWRSARCRRARAGSGPRRCRRCPAPPRAARPWRWRCPPSAPCPRPAAP